MQQRQKPLRPDGSEAYIGAVVALFVGVVLLALGFPWWSYILAALLLYVACVYGIQIRTEDDRQNWKADALAQTILNNLKVIEYHGREVRSPDARKNISDGVANTRAIIDELRSKKSTQFYGGLVQLEPHVRRMLSVSEYVDVIQNPRKAGQKYMEVVTKAEQGFQGFAEETQRLLERANAGDILDLTVNAEILRSLRNLLSTKEK